MHKKRNSASVLKFVIKPNEDFWNKLAPFQQQEILGGTAEINRGGITDYETFIAKHRR